MKLKNATLARPMVVRGLCRLGDDGWQARYGYGMRWIAECVFSEVKRVLGEAFRYGRSDLMLREA
jgi:hypothetical protein